MHNRAETQFQFQILICFMPSLAAGFLPLGFLREITLAQKFGTAGLDCLMGAAERDGVQLGQVEWALTDESRTSVEAAALTRAVDQARVRALAIAQAAGWADVEVEEVADPGLLAPPPGGGAVPLAAEASYGRMAFKHDSGGGGGLAPEDVRGEAVIHARFRATG